MTNVEELARQIAATGHLLSHGAFVGENRDCVRVWVNEREQAALLETRDFNHILADAFSEVMEDTYRAHLVVVKAENGPMNSAYVDFTRDPRDCQVCGDKDCVEFRTLGGQLLCLTCSSGLGGRRLPVHAMGKKAFAVERRNQLRG